MTHGIDEAVFLSGRAAIMQAEPGRIVDTVDVPFPRPRYPALFSDGAFRYLCDRIATVPPGG